MELSKTSNIIQLILNIILIFSAGIPLVFSVSGLIYFAAFWSIIGVSLRYLEYSIYDYITIGITINSYKFITVPALFLGVSKFISVGYKIINLHNNARESSPLPKEIDIEIDTIIKEFFEKWDKYVIRNLPTAFVIVLVSSSVVILLSHENLLLVANLFFHIIYSLLIVILSIMIFRYFISYFRRGFIQSLLVVLCFLLIDIMFIAPLILGTVDGVTKTTLNNFSLCEIQIVNDQNNYMNCKYLGKNSDQYLFKLDGNIVVVDKTSLIKLVIYNK